MLSFVSARPLTRRDVALGRGLSSTGIEEFVSDVARVDGKSGRLFAVF